MIKLLLKIDHVLFECISPYIESLKMNFYDTKNFKFELIFSIRFALKTCVPLLKYMHNFIIGYDFVLYL